jgi:hypothetical protein
MDAAEAQTLPAVVSTLDPSESLANAAQVSHPLVQKLHLQCPRSLAFREDENSKLIDFIRPDGVTSSSQRSDETIRHEQDGLPHKSGLQPAVKESKQFWYREHNGDVFIQIGIPHSVRVGSGVFLQVPVDEAGTPDLDGAFPQNEKAASIDMISRGR